MGVTIHFDGRLRSREALDRLVVTARRFAAERGWPCQPINESLVTLKRVRNEEPWDYSGPTTGLAMQPHESAEPFRLEFDRDLYLQEYVKTQFAPAEVHIAIVELLRLLAPEFEVLSVEDEGEYWDTADVTKLRTHMDACHHALQDILHKAPDHHGPIRLPSGRIIDYMSRE